MATPTPPPAPRDVAIVVPTLDETGAVSRLLPRAMAQGAEVVVSDGGSSDDTVARAASLGARIVSGPAGRGVQLNRGAAAATRPILVFLHADTVLPDDGVARVVAAVGSGAVGGGFLVRFDTPNATMRLGARLINWRTRWLRLPLGDQAQFVTRSTFEALGGYRAWPILEDLDFARRLKRHAGGRLALIDSPVTTAARRFAENGAARTVATNWLIWGLFFCGVAPDRLARLYRKVR